jgi:tetratricopeptide (TPR) repeat protein
MPFNVMIAACESWLRIDPNSAEAYAWIGSHFGDSKNYDQAIAYLNRAIALKPNFAFAYSIRGGIYTQKGLASMDPKLRNTDSGFKNQAINQAIADYRTVLRVDPGGNYASGAQFQLKLLGASP